MCILIVEDEPKSAEYLRQGLSESGYTADVARTGLVARHQHGQLLALRRRQCERIGQFQRVHRAGMAVEFGGTREARARAGQIVRTDSS